MASFAAIDFETANHSPESACSIGIVRISDSRIVERTHRLIRPPQGPWIFSDLHGIGPANVRNEPAFREIWLGVAGMTDDADFLVAHNASFDARVLHACCRSANLPMPRVPFVCSLAVARDHLGIRPTNLAAVCHRLSIPLRHHDALSDAEAAARILLVAMRTGWTRKR